MPKALRQCVPMRRVERYQTSLKFLKRTAVGPLKLGRLLEENRPDATRPAAVPVFGAVYRSSVRGLGLSGLDYATLTV